MDYTRGFMKVNLNCAFLLLYGTPKRLTTVAGRVPEAHPWPPAVRHDGRIQHIGEVDDREGGRASIGEQCDGVTRLRCFVQSRSFVRTCSLKLPGTSSRLDPDMEAMIKGASLERFDLAIKLARCQKNKIKLACGAPP